MKRLLTTLCLTFLVALICLRGSAVATETKNLDIGIGFWTRHVSPSNDTNEHSRLIILGYRRWFAARFINSYHDETYFGGRQFYSKDLKPFDSCSLFLRGNLYGGILYGYEDIPNLAKFTPAIFPTLCLGFDVTQKSEAGLEMLYIPTGSGGVFINFVMYRYKF